MTDEYEAPRSFAVCDLLEFLQAEIADHSQWVDSKKRNPCVVTQEEVRQRRRKIESLQATVAMVSVLDGQNRELRAHKETLYEMIEATGWGDHDENGESSEPPPEEAGLAVLTVLRRWYSDQADKTLQGFLQMKRDIARGRR